MLKELIYQKTKKIKMADRKMMTIIPAPVEFTFVDCSSVLEGPMQKTCFCKDHIVDYNDNADPLVARYYHMVSEWLKQCHSQELKLGSAYVDSVESEGTANGRMRTTVSVSAAAYERIRASDEEAMLDPTAYQPVEDTRAALVQCSVSWKSLHDNLSGEVIFYDYDSEYDWGHSVTEEFENAWDELSGIYGHDDSD